MVMAGDRAVSPLAPSDAWGTDETGVDWDYLYRRYAPPLRALIASRVPRGVPVEDILQDTFTRAIRSTPRIDTSRPAWPFLATVAGRAVADWWTREHIHRPVEYPTSVVTDEYPGSDAHAQSLDRVIGTRRVLAAMTPRHRRVLYLYEGEGWSYDTLTEAEQVSVKAMKSLLGRARGCFHARYRELVGGTPLGVLVGMRIVLSRLRARLGQWQDGMARESLAAVGGLVVVAAVVGAATSPLASATVSHRAGGLLESYSSAIHVPAPVVGAERNRHGSNHPATAITETPHQHEATPPTAAPLTPTLLDAGGGIVNTSDRSTASFWITAGQDPLGNELRVGTETRCDQGQVAARKCEAIRTLPGSS